MPTSCVIQNCTNDARWYPVLHAWPRKGELQFAVNAPISLGLDKALCKAHTPLFEAGVVRIDWKHIVALAKAKGYPAPDKNRVDFVWLEAGVDAVR